MAAALERTITSRFRSKKQRKHYTAEEKVVACAANIGKSRRDGSVLAGLEPTNLTRLMTAF